MPHLCALVSGKVLTTHQRDRPSRNGEGGLGVLRERMGPIQGGFFWMVEWDDSIQTPDGPGDVKISILHPKQKALITA